MSELQKNLSLLVRFAPEGEQIRLESGKQTTWHIDCSPVTLGSPADVGFDVVNALTDAGILPKDYDAIGAPTSSLTTGVPIAVAAAMVGGHRAFAVRNHTPRDAKSVTERLMGAYQPGDRVVLVDDVYATGRTLHDAVTVCTKAGLTIVAALVLVYRGNVSEDLTPPDQMILPVTDAALPEGETVTVPFVPLFLPTDLGVEPEVAYFLDEDA